MTDKPSDRPDKKPMGDGPRKPKATFGDVMKGIPAGRGGEREERRDNKRDDRGPRRDDRGPRPEGGPPAPGGEQKAEGRGRPPHKRGGKPEEQPKKGPEVVVVRKPAGAPGDEAAKTATPKPVMPSLVYSRPVEEQEAETESFADLLAKSDVKSSRGGVRPGSKVTGVIIQLGTETAFLTLKEGGEAMIDLRELTGEAETGEATKTPKVGDVVEGYVVSVGGREGGVLVSKGLGKGAANLDRLRTAAEGGVPVEGTVTGVNKGGLEIDLGGGVRGFCPISQVDLRFVEKPETYVGQKLQFRVSEVKDDDVVLSRRALLEAERAAVAEKTRANLAIGARMRGKVTSLREFGAFVDLGGVEGLIHISEMSHGRIKHPSEVLQQGQEVEVEVTKIDAADPNSPDKSKQRERIGLSLRALEASPWDDIEARFPLGAKVTGKVVRLQPFGAFVELAPGVDGLIHISNMADRRINHPKEVVNEGQEVEVVVEKVEVDARRIGLALWREGYTPLSEREAPPPHEAHERPEQTEGGAPARAPAARRPSVGQVVEASVDKVEPFGIFVSFTGGRGLVPNAEMGTPKGTDHKKQFPVGTKFKAQIIEIDNQGRLRLSKTQAEMSEERAEVSKYLAESQPKQKGKGFGTLGDLLKNKLGQK